MDTFVQLSVHVSIQVLSIRCMQCWKQCTAEMA